MAFGYSWVIRGCLIVLIILYKVIAQDKRVKVVGFAMITVSHLVYSIVIAIPLLM